MIELMYRELQRAYEQGESELGVVYIAGGEDIGVYLRDNTASQNNVAKVLDVSGGEAVGLFRYVYREGYVGLSRGSNLSSTFNRVTMDYITPLGLAEIGELPDPQQRFLMGLEAAIQAIREDDRIPEKEKKRGIDWLEEGKQIGRPLTVEVIEAVWKGDLPFL